MWFVFPQIAGLGHSATSRTYAITSLEEARAYLGHDVLGPRLIECAGLVAGATEGRTAEQIFGSVDAQKLHSSMTLFMLAQPDDPVFAAGARSVLRRPPRWGHRPADVGTGLRSDRYRACSGRLCRLLEAGLIPTDSVIKGDTNDRPGACGARQAGGGADRGRPAHVPPDAVGPVGAAGCGHPGSGAVGGRHRPHHDRRPVAGRGRAGGGGPVRPGDHGRAPRSAGSSRPPTRPPCCCWPWPGWGRWRTRSSPSCASARSASSWARPAPGC